MNVFTDKWEQIRDKFTEEEKEKLRSEIIGQTICPSGTIINEEKLDPELRRKITEAIASPYGLFNPSPTQGVDQVAP